MARSTREQDARGLPIEQPDDVEIPTTGSIDEVRTRAAKGLSTPEIESVADMLGAMDKFKRLAFYEEKLDVMLMDSMDPNPEPYVFVSVNGRGPMPGAVSQWVPRNQIIPMARKYVEVLARAKPVSMRTVDGIDAEGYKTKVLKQTMSLRYPFTVIRDPNPRGPAWLREVMRQR